MATHVTRSAAQDRIPPHFRIADAGWVRETTFANTGERVQVVKTTPGLARCLSIEQCHFEDIGLSIIVPKAVNELSLRSCIIGGFLQIIGTLRQLELTIKKKPPWVGNHSGWVERRRNTHQ